MASPHAAVTSGVVAEANRSVEWNTSPDTSPAALWVVSTSVNAPVNDEFKITYRHGSFALAYEPTAGGPVTSQFTVTVAGLVEWLPSGDGGFSDGETVAYAPMGSPEFGRIPITHYETRTAEGVAVHSFLIQSDSGELAMNLTIAQGFVTRPSGSTLTPMEAELTFELNHVMNRTDTRLAIQLSFTSGTAGQSFSLDNESWDDEHEFSPDEAAVNVTNEAGPIHSSAWFAWSNTAEVNGQVGSVEATGESNETTGGYDLYLSYPRTPGTGDPDQINIVHDPSIGVVSAAYQSILDRTPPPPGIQADIPLYAGTVVAAAALVAGTALLARRQRRGRK
jgi:hypothetical protein